MLRSEMAPVAVSKQAPIAAVPSRESAVIPHASNPGSATSTRWAASDHRNALLGMDGPDMIFVYPATTCPSSEHGAFTPDPVTSSNPYTRPAGHSGSDES